MEWYSCVTIIWTCSSDCFKDLLRHSNICLSTNVPCRLHSYSSSRLHQDVWCKVILGNCVHHFNHLVNCCWCSYAVCCVHKTNRTLNTITIIIELKNRYFVVVFKTRMHSSIHGYSSSDFYLLLF